MSLVFSFIVIVINIIYVFKFFFEVIIFLNFAPDLDVNAAPIFPDHSNNFCVPKDLLLSLMMSKKLLTMMFSFPLLWVDLDMGEAAAISVCS